MNIVRSWFWITAYRVASISSMRLDEDWSTNSSTFDIKKIQGDESNENCVFVETDSLRFRLASRGKEEYVVLNVEKNQGIIQKATRFASNHPYQTALIGLPLVVAGAGAGATAAGFGSAGIIVGSVAASIQSAMGSVAGGSCFAFMQSLGATGTFSAMTTAGLVASAGSAGAVAAINKSGNATHANKDTDGDPESETCESNNDDSLLDIGKFLGSNAKIVDSKKLVIFLEK